MVIPDFVMFAIGARFIVLMAKNTFKGLVIICIHMAISTSVPFVAVGAGINGEKLAVMVPGALPPVGCIMTLLTLLWE